MKPIHLLGLSYLKHIFQLNKCCFQISTYDKLFQAQIAWNVNKTLTKLFKYIPLPILQ